jgi:hypothetical protein
LKRRALSAKLQSGKSNMSVARHSLMTVLCAGLLAAAAPSVAQPLTEMHADKAANPVTATGGVIFQNGAVFVGEHFTVKHKVTGEYVVTFAKGLFALNPVFSCAISGAASPPAPPSCQIYSTRWTSAAHDSAATFHIYDVGTGEPIDANFQFTAVAVKSDVAH